MFEEEHQELLLSCLIECVRALLSLVEVHGSFASIITNLNIPPSHTLCFHML